MRTLEISFVTAVAVLVAAAGARPALAQVACGDVVGPGRTVVLQADLACDDVASGLVVHGPAVLDLNGHSLVCDDRNGNGREVITGILVEGAGVTLRNGAVRGCRAGVIVAGSGNHALSDVSVLFSASDGFRIESDRNRVSGSFSFFNGLAGFSIEGKANLLSGNAATGNDFGFTMGQRNTLTANIASGSERSGFIVRGRQAKLKGNRAVGGAIGFEVTGQSNRFEGNESANNTTGFVLVDLAKRNVLDGNVASDSGFNGFAVAGVANRLVENRAERNDGNGIRVASTASRTVVRATFARDNADEDLFDNTPGCGTNRWRNNSFGTSNEPCIE